MPEFNPAASVARARRAMRKVRRIENAASDSVLADLREARGELLARLAGPGSDFARADALTLFREVDAVIRELEERMKRGLRGALLVAGDLGSEAVQGDAVASGISPFRIRPVLSQPTIAAAATEAAMEEVTGITANAKVALRQELRRAVSGGLTMRQFTQRIGRALPGPGPFGTAVRRAELVARNEVLNVFQFGKEAQQERFREDGIGYRKTWVTSRDARVRPTHLVLDGVTKDAEEDFDVGGFPASRPRDPRLPPSEAIGCRCDLALQFAENRLKSPAGGITLPAVGITVS